MDLVTLLRCARLAKTTLGEGHRVQIDAGPRSAHYLRRASTYRTLNHGDRYGQTWEPAGEYMQPLDGPVAHKEPMVVGRDRTWFEHGQVHMRNPVVVQSPDGDHVGWKRALSEHMGGLTGAKLSSALRARGHDGVVVEMGGRPAEMVNLGGTKEVSQGLPPEALRYDGARRSASGR